MKEEEVFISVKEDHMIQRNYDPMISLVAAQGGYIKDTYRIIEKTEFIRLLREKLKLTRYKAKKIIEVYIDLNLISEDDKYYRFNPIQSYFIKLTLSTAIYFIDNLSDYVFKVYCWFLNKYENHLRMVEKYKKVDNYFFSIEQIIKGVGYTKNNTTWSRTVEALNTLEQLEYISYNHKRVGRPGHHGTYYELYWVHKYGTAQIKATEDIIEHYGEEVIPEEIATRMVATNKDDLVLKERADKAKNLLNQGYSMSLIEPEYLNAYKQVYQ